MDAFTAAMFEAALFAETDGDEPLDKNYGVSDFAPIVRKALEDEARKFQRQNSDDIAAGPVRGRYPADEQAGHDFWLTRNGHGAGFWDGDWPKAAGERLTKASKKYGQVDLYVGDDKKIWASGYEKGPWRGARGSLSADVLPSLYEELKAAGIKMDSHESDLYVLETPAVRGIIAQFPMHAKNATRFRDRRDGKMWIDVPFAYDPWWKKAEARDRRRVGRQA